MSFGLLVALVTVVFVAALAIPLLYHYRKVTGQYSKGADRRTATAVVQSVQDANIYINNKPEFAFELLVKLPDGTTKTVRTKRLMEFSEMTAFQPGSIVKVSYGKDNLRDLYIEGYAEEGDAGFQKIDMSDPASIEKLSPLIDTLPEPAKTAILGAMETYKQAMSGNPTDGYAGVIKQFTGFTGMAVDTAEEIRKLAELRDQGILTEEEFTAKKKQLLQI